MRTLRRDGHHFRRQAPFGPYVLDFVSYRDRLVVEVDGSQHGEAHEKAADAMRDGRLAAEGFVVLRFWNNKIEHSMDGVWRTIADALLAAALRRSDSC